VCRLNRRAHRDGVLSHVVQVAEGFEYLALSAVRIRWCVDTASNSSIVSAPIVLATGPMKKKVRPQQILKDQVNPRPASHP